MLFLYIYIQKQSISTNANRISIVEMEKNDHTICIGIVPKLHIIYDVLFSFSMTDYIISQSIIKKNIILIGSNHI